MRDEEISDRVAKALRELYARDTSFSSYTDVYKAEVASACRYAVAYMISARRYAYAGMVVEGDSTKARRQWGVVYKVRFRGRAHGDRYQRTVVARLHPGADLIRSFTDGTDPDGKPWTPIHWSHAYPLAEALEREFPGDLAPFHDQVWEGRRLAEQDPVLQKKLRAQDADWRKTQHKEQGEELSTRFRELMVDGWTRDMVTEVWDESEVREVMER